MCYPLSLYSSSLVKCLFKSLAYLFNWVLKFFYYRIERQKYFGYKFFIGYMLWKYFLPASLFIFLKVFIVMSSGKN